jgi:hypothetical protein
MPLFPHSSNSDLLLSSVAISRNFRVHQHLLTHETF